MYATKFRRSKYIPYNIHLKNMEVLEKWSSVFVCISIIIALWQRPLTLKHCNMEHVRLKCISNNNEFINKRANCTYNKFQVSKKEKFYFLSMKYIHRERELPGMDQNYRVTAETAGSGQECNFLCKGVIRPFPWLHLHELWRPHLRLCSLYQGE